MITPRSTRLVRVATLHDFRRTLVALCEGPLVGQTDAATDAPARLVVVPSHAAARTLADTMRSVSNRPADGALPLTFACVTRDELYDALHARLADPPARLSPFERDVMAQSAAVEAASEVGDLPFRVRPGLVAEMLRFYDQLRRQSQTVLRFKQRMMDALGGGELDDRGADRLVRQTQFLARAFAGYEQRAAAAQAFDEHRLRDRLLADADALPLAHVIVTVPDWIADPAGLFVADFDLLSQLPNLAAIDIVATETTLGSGFHERLHTWWPGLDEIDGAALAGPAATVRPYLVIPEPTPDQAPLFFTHRDREEELLAVARRLKAEPPASFDRVAVVFKKPLPYLYLAGDTLGHAGLPFEATDALPLATEPLVATIDLLLDALESDLARDTVVALLRSPHLSVSRSLSRESVGALDRALSNARFLGGVDRLLACGAAWSRTEHAGEASRRRGADLRVLARPALDAACALATDLRPCLEPRRASEQLGTLIDVFAKQAVTPVGDEALQSRERRARATVLRLLQGLADAHVAHYDPEWRVADLATAVRRWIGDQTFAAEPVRGGIRLLDDQAARYGDFDDLTVVGLIESDWPDKARRNIFYPPTLLKALGWPSEKDRRGAADARFLDLLSSAHARVELSAFLLDDEAIVSRSIQLDEVPRARLSTVTRPLLTEPLLPDEALAFGTDTVDLEASTRDWLTLRHSRSAPDLPVFHGSTGSRAPRAWSVSALEVYLGCPFKFYAQHVLRLEEEPDDEEVMDPRRQGQFVHEVFEAFFREWQDGGQREISAADLPAARTLFTKVVDEALTRVPEGEAGLERTRLLGSPAAAGLGEAVFRMEAERPVPVVARLLEHTLDGTFTLRGSDGERQVPIRGRVDRIDLLGDGTFRLIDYKLGWPPDRSRALQLPIYGLCAEQQLRELGRRWTLGEAVYLAFKGPKRVVPLFATDAARDETLTRAQQRMLDTLDAIERGDFPPTPDDVYRCDNCGFASVCRKDYVGDL